MVSALAGQLRGALPAPASRTVLSGAKNAVPPWARGQVELAIEVDEAAILHALGSAITDRRTQLGMSQRGLATEAGLDRVFLRGIEDGTRKATVITLIRLATALDTTAADLLGNC